LLLILQRDGADALTSFAFGKAGSAPSESQGDALERAFNRPHFLIVR
jgi:hypothetical protein